MGILGSPDPLKKIQPPNYWHVAQDIRAHGITIGCAAGGNFQHLGASIMDTCHLALGCQLGHVKPKAKLRVVLNHVPSAAEVPVEVASYYNAEKVFNIFETWWMTSATTCFP